MKRSSKPVFVTGSHRSGTTWAGQMISAAPHVAYIHEPFNPNVNAWISPNPFKNWFEYICDENSGDYTQIIDEIVHFRHPLSLNRKFPETKTPKNIIREIRNQGLYLLHKLNRDRPLIKDPIAFFSAEWLYKRYNMDVLVLIRHPAAFCSSLKIMNWEFDFNNFLKQPLLMERYLYPFEKEIREFAKNKKHNIEKGILQWNCIHNTIKIYREKYPDWLFIKHEDLSADPVNQFKSIYQKFGVEFTQKAKKIIQENSGTHNPVEQQEGFEYKRNSKENIKTWKWRLSQEEISQIRMKTSQVASSFYTEAEW